MQDALRPREDHHGHDEPVSARHAARTARAVDAGDLDELSALLAGASDPVLVAGAGNDSAGGWAALTALAERLACPVWQEPFSARGFALAAAHPGRVPWPGFEEIDLAATARSLGCPAQRIETRDELAAALDAALRGREDPLVLDVRVA